jgi:hypothetical protein
MTLCRTLSLAIVVAAVCVGSSAGARSDYPYYVDQLTIDTTLEANGFRHNYRHVEVYSALCLGLRRRGVRTSQSGAILYWRFKCDVVGVSEHYYTLQVSTTAPRNSDGWYLHILSARLEY